MANIEFQLLDVPYLSPVTIGVYGDWGSGKSSVALMLKAELDKEPRASDTLGVVFNGWRFDGYDDAKSALMTTILEELEKRQTIGHEAIEGIKKLAKRVNWLRVGKTTSRYALHAGLAVATGGASVIPSLAAEAAAAAKEAKAEDIVDKAGDYLVAADEAKKVHDTVREFEAEFSKVLGHTSLRRLVVIIDDLDRCDPTQIIETLEAIRLFLAVPKTAFIIAADEMMVQHAARLRFPGLEGQTDSLGRNYLEKMVQIPVRVPPLGPRDLETYLNMLFLQLHLREEEFKGSGFFGGSTGFSTEQAAMSEMEIKPKTRYLPAVADIKMSELPFIRLPPKVHLRYVRARRTFVTPGHDFLDPFLFAFEQRLDPAVRKVPDPASHAELHRLFLRAGTEEDALDQTLDNDVSAKIF